MDDNLNITGISLEKVLAYDGFSAVTKLTATKLMQNPYMTLGDFFKGLTNNDITLLNFMVDAAAAGGEEVKDIICLAEMLSRAEGTDKHDINSTVDNVNALMMFINLVSLERKGLVTIKYENMSFGEELGDAVLAIRN